MKSIFALSVLLLTSPAFALGLDCVASDGGSIEVLTGESAIEGDSVETLGLLIPEVQSSAFLFQRERNEVNVKRNEKSALYMAANNQGDSASFIWRKGVNERSEIYARINGKIYEAQLKCVGPAGQ